MSVTAHDILEFAKRLASGENEIDWRDSAARAYYAAYHQARLSEDLCPSNDHIKMGAHERLSNRFDLHHAKGGKSISMILQMMKRYRHAADYEISDPFEQSTAVNQIANAQALKDRLVAFENTHRPQTA